MTHSIVTQIGPVSAVAFDMDGLMFDTERIMLDMWAKPAAIHGWQLSEGILLSTVGVSAEETRDMLVAECGPAFPHDAIRAERLRLEKEYFLARGVPLKCGLADLLEFLKRLGIPCGVATSTSGDRARDVLGCWDISRLSCAETRWYTASPTLKSIQSCVTGWGYVQGSALCSRIRGPAYLRHIPPAACRSWFPIWWLPMQSAVKRRSALSTASRRCSAGLLCTPYIFD